MNWLSRLDPRTIIFAFPIALTCAFLLSKEAWRDLAFIGLLFLALASAGRFPYALKWALALLMIHVPFFYLETPPYQFSFLAISVRKICMIFCTGMIIFSSLSTSSCVNTMKKANMHKNVIIPVAVCFRFVPTLRLEARVIRDAMKVRGLFSAGRILRHPLTTLEVFTSTLLFRVMTLGEELAFSFATRGLELKGKHFYREIGFSLRDAAFVLTLGLAVLVILTLPLSELQK